MPFVDWIPGVSQLKALVQLVTGDTQGACRTQANFLRECPVVSQVTSTIQELVGYKKAAIETQKRCSSTVNNIFNCIPFIGHLEGHRHYVDGDHNGGNQALNAATRSTVVAASGAIAREVLGGIGAILATIAAGAIYDVAASLISSKVQGIVAAYKNYVDNPSAGAIFDLVAILVGDGLTGYCICVTLKYETDGNARQVALRKRKHKENDIQKKLKRMEQLDKQKPQGALNNEYKRVDTTTLDKLLSVQLRRFKNDPFRDPNWNPELKKVVNQLLSKSWLFFITPKVFPYTVVNQLNSERQGVCHSFIRHINQWSEVIAFDNTLIDRISPLETQIENLVRAVETPENDKALIEFEKARSQLERPKPYYDVQTALLEIQMSLHRFIQKNMTSDNYLGRTINDNDHEQLYFKVMTNKRKPKFMVVCISDQLYEPETTPEPTLPIRTLVTVFFKSWENYNPSYLL